MAEVATETAEAVALVRAAYAMVNAHSTPERRQAREALLNQARLFADAEDASKAEAMELALAQAVGALDELAAAAEQAGEGLVKKAQAAREFVRKARGLWGRS